MNGRVVWRKVASCAETRCDLYDVTVPNFHSFIGNGFINHNTRSVLHRVARHLYDNDKARVGMFARTMKSTKDGGSWTLMHNIILPEWFAAKVGMRYTTETGGIFGVKTDGITRTPYFRVRNRYGGESEMLLFSLDNDDDVEAKLKELEFSMIYFSELDKFGDKRVLTVALPSLRLSTVPYEDQMWIADCNPSEEGEQSWIYQEFYVKRLMAYETYAEFQRQQDLPPLPERDFREFYSRLDAIQILPEHNPFVDPRQLQDVRVSCGSDQGLYARHVEGKWVWGGGDASRHFRSLWGDGRRFLVGLADGPEEEWEVALPTVNCFELITGWDLGDKNHAAVILEKYFVNNQPCFVVLDEQVSIGEEVSNEEFTLSFMELIEQQEQEVGRRLSLERAWSDSSSLEKYSSAADTYPYLQVHAASQGRIVLQGIRKAPGSVRIRVNELKKFLAQGRIKVSAHCVHTIQMFRDLRKGKDKVNFVVQDLNKHVFDALTYALLGECAEELEARPQAGARPSLFVQVA